MNNPLEEVARIANDPTLPRRRRLHLIQEFLSALGNATGSAVSTGVESEPKPTTNQHETGRDDPEQSGERTTTTGGNAIQTPPCNVSGRTFGNEKEHAKTQNQTSKEALMRASHNATSHDERGRRESFTARLKREHPEEYEALRAARNAVARALYDPEKERKRKARKEKLHPGREAARKREWDRTHRESRNRMQRAWLAAHPEKAAEYRRRYREKRKALGLPNQHEDAAKRWAALCADEEAHVAFNAERAAYRRKKRPHKRDYRACPSRMHHAYERYCPAFAPGAHGASGVGFSRELWREQNLK